MDSQNGEGKILVDKIDNKLTVTVPVTNQPPDYNSNPAQPTTAVAPTPQANAEPKKAKFLRIEEPPDLSLSDAPEPPDLFPPNWELSVEDHFPLMGEAPAASAPEESIAEVNVEEPANAVDGNEEETPLEPPIDLVAEVVTAGLGAVVSPAPRGVAAVPFLPPRPAGRGGERQPRMVTIYLRSKGDKARDILAIRRVHGALISYPGADRFAFYMFEGRSGYLLDFPNDTTDLNDGLLARLEAMVGANNLRIEPITVH